MSFSSISSTYPEPATSPSPRTSPTPVGHIHLPLKHTFAFYIPREISVPARPNATASQMKRSRTRKCKGAQRTRSSLRVGKKEREQGNAETQNEVEDTMAPPGKRRKIKD
ncbi:hypothetical protein FRC02_006141 [Tulasnella sp. 418]|nr:hypothetical protein FRC02_006141 [Tulasnella sp. 418]